MLHNVLVLLLCVVCVFSEEPSERSIEEGPAPAAETRRAPAAAPSAVTSMPMPKRSDERPDTINWEYSPESMVAALNYMKGYLNGKYPSTAAQRGQYFYHQIGFELVQNVTPKELNTPDAPVGNGFYGTQGLIAVFVFKIKIIRNLAAQSQTMQLLGNINRMTGQADQMPQTPQSEVATKMYIVSIPRFPFQRAPNFMANPAMASIMGATGVNTAPQTQDPNAKLKAMFPTNRAAVKSIKDEAELKALLSGQTSASE